MYKIYTNGYIQGKIWNMLYHVQCAIGLEVQKPLQLLHVV